MTLFASEFSEKYTAPPGRWGAFNASRWLGGASAGEDDQWSRRELSLQTKAASTEVVKALLKSEVFSDVTHLPMVGGGRLGPAKLEDGTVLKWTYWFPHRKLLLDEFKKMPPESEMEVRQKFAQSNALFYLHVEPGWRVTADELKQALEEKETAARVSAGS